MERLVANLKMYWQLNKGSLLIYGATNIILTFMSGGFLEYVFVQLELFENNLEHFETAIQSGAMSTELINSSISMVMFGMIIGGLGIFLLIYGIYLLLRPFTKKQVQQVLLVGRSAYNYICTHIGVIILLKTLTTLICHIVLINFFQDLAYEFSSITDIVRLHINDIGFTMWILLIPLLIQNGKLLNNLSYAKKKVVIICSVIGSYLALNIAIIIYELKNNFTIHLENVQKNTIQYTEINTSYLSLGISILGIIIGVWAITSYRKNYRIDL